MLDKIICVIDNVFAVLYFDFTYKMTSLMTSHVFNVLSASHIF